eukprot:6197973-Pleurochrysis_carterae.AAC.1
MSRPWGERGRLSWLDSLESLLLAPACAHGRRCRLPSLWCISLFVLSLSGFFGGGANFGLSRAGGEAFDGRPRVPPQSRAQGGGRARD